MFIMQINISNKEFSVTIDQIQIEIIRLIQKFSILTVSIDVVKNNK